MSAAIAFALSNWRWLLPLIACAGFALDAGIHRIEAANCKAAFATYKQKQAEAVAEQQAKDRELSQRLLNEQRESLSRLHEQAISSLKTVSNAPITSTCGPVQRDATRGVRELFAVPGGKAAGP